MIRIGLSGWGAVTPAGWGMAAVRQALDRNEPLPATALLRPDGISPLSARLVPPPYPRPAFMAHPRLRRASDLTHYAAAAVLEAMGMEDPSRHPQRGQLGLIFCLLAGCTQYSARFFHEVISDPATASPVLFPETVYNAPASHIAVLLGDAPHATTLIGDSATFLQGVALGARWLLEGSVERCVVVGAEETNWLLADALWSLNRGDVLSGGAGAVVLRPSPDDSTGLLLETITDAFTYSTNLSRAQAADNMRRALPDSSHSEQELLVEGTQDRHRQDAAETAAWRNWQGIRLRPKTVLGEGLMAASAWQFVLACDVLARGGCRAANISLVGGHQQAIGARIVKL